jgi:hypothetical protein
MDIYFSKRFIIKRGKENVILMIVVNFLGHNHPPIKGNAFSTIAPSPRPDSFQQASRNLHLQLLTFIINIPVRVEG